MQAPDVSESDNDMFTKLKDGLDDQDYLIVMDDVWPKPDLEIFWTELCNILPTKVGKSSCIIITTRYKDVARDFEIHVDQLIHWWLGDGLIQGEEGYSKTALEWGYEHLTKLATRCLLEVVDQRGYDGRIYKFKIHDMVREFITKIVEKQKFCNFSEEGMQIKIEDSRWLCLAEDMLLRKFVLLESLRVLDLSYSKLNMINVEDNSTPCSGICVKKFFQLIASLRRLACLNLTRVQKLLEVTSEIEKLLNLQVLVLNGCNNLGKIHPKISSLKRLVVLDIKICPLLQHLPRELGSLSYRQELSGFRVVSRAKTQGCTLLELGKLEQLRVLRITICDVAEISEEETKSLSSLQNLKVDWNDLKRVMPALRYMEISNCSNLKNFPIHVIQPGVWRK
ncbi:hypothetical protein M0R45_026034 [Rubus argutus]|uniref:NB-ARC domain-containing protein n=1 Tax=Rubus argutus TaxID=59490 RepID=A0AAW1WYV4_RUBAR